MSNKIAVYNCSYIHASDLFEGYRHLWNEWVECGPDFSWGDNDHSLVTVQDILFDMDNHDIEYSDNFIKRCEEVGLQTYVDLEN